ncbi:MAG: HupE/UreJ family protein, partial [Gammaproteobacteria bacterium]|nr:HupE/UreJ family protein [Gammaproteobacteria bacterium]
GFASALAEIGLPQTEIPAALLAFNLGVEIGQVVFVSAIIAAAWVVKYGLQRFTPNPVKWLSLIEKPVAYSIGGITMFWTLERVSAFWI